MNFCNEYTFHLKRKICRWDTTKNVQEWQQKLVDNESFEKLKEFLEALNESFQKIETLTPQTEGKEGKEVLKNITNIVKKKFIDNFDKSNVSFLPLNFYLLTS